MTTLTPVTHKTKCDVRDCKRDAEYSFPVKGIMGKCYICADCLMELTKQSPTPRIPKSPTNTIKKKMEQKDKELNYDEK